MFQRATLSSLAMLLALALLMRQGQLALICLLLLLVAGMAALWNHWALRRVGYERRFSQARAFPDDCIELQLHLTNRKPLPIASLRLLERIPVALELQGVTLRPAGTTATRLLQRTTALRWYEGVTWRYQVRCLARGAFHLGPAQLVSGDPFGIYSTIRDLPLTPTSLIVYPRLLPLADLRLPARNPLGDVRAGLLFRDPLRIVGVRAYTPDDPLKDVHWPATARSGSLQTRVYEPTTARSIALMLDLDTFTFYYEGIDPEQVERLISAAATIAREGVQAGYALGLYANGTPAEAERLVRLPPSRHPDQLHRILETLARLTGYSATPMAHLLRSAVGDLPAGATLVLISAVATDATRAALLRQRQAGREVVWLFLGDTPPAPLAGVRLHHAPPKPPTDKA